MSQNGAAHSTSNGHLYEYKLCKGLKPIALIQIDAHDGVIISQNGTEDRMKYLWKRINKIHFNVAIRQP